MKIRTKLIITIGALVSILLLSGIYSYRTNLNTHKSNKQVMDVQDLLKQRMVTSIHSKKI